MPASEPARPPRGIGGWLLLFLALMVAAALISLAFLVVSRIEIARWAEVNGRLPLRLELSGWFLGLAKIVIPLAIVRRMVRDRRWRSVQLAIAGLWLLWLALPLVDIAHVLIAGDPLPPGTWRLVAIDLLRGALFAFAATAYLLASRRVEATYPRLRPGETQEARDTFA